jgi:hypothetical protein
MQLRAPDPERRAGAGAVRTALAAAACALLGALPTPAPAMQIEGATLVYTEPGRVTAVETVIEGVKETDAGGAYSLKLAIDALTGASANGAVPANRVQTFTRPSGESSYTVNPGETPLDPSFKDTRVAATGAWMRPLGRMDKMNLGVNLSYETDYLSLGLSGGFARDFALRSSTLATSLSYAHDIVEPHGGAPDPFTVMAPPEADGGRSVEEDDDDDGGESSPGKGKDVGDFLLGFTQVLDRATIARVNYTAGVSFGYLTDPYKILSVVEAPDGAQPGDPTAYLYERRPDQRTKQSVYGEIRRHIGPDVVAGSYRYYWDSWGVRSSTVDLHLAQPLGRKDSLEPHYRYYHQHEAEFYTAYLVSGRPLPSYASADYRLGAFRADTFGLEAVHTLDSGTAFRAGLEYYLQRGDPSPPDAYGALAEQDLFPDVSAWMVRVGASVPIH